MTSESVTVSRLGIAAFSRQEDVSQYGQSSIGKAHANVEHLLEAAVRESQYIYTSRPV